MKIELDAQRALSTGFAAIIEQYDLPIGFSDEVLRAAEVEVNRVGNDNRPLWMSGRRDISDIPFVTLDPATSTDLDQAFYLERDGDEIVLYYALADVDAFVSSGGLVENEAWKRGVTIYGLAEKVSLYPKSISQAAASLLPGGPKPAVLVVVSANPSGAIRLRGIEKVICRSHAKLAYDTVDLGSISYLKEYADRISRNEVERGAIRVDFPQQEVVVDHEAPGGVRLVLRARVESEVVNSSLSLSVNLAIGQLLKSAKVGLFRVMDDPDPRAIARLRRSAHALGIAWKQSDSLRELQKTMDPNNGLHQRFLLDARRAGGRATYAAYSEEKQPWHAAIAGVYSHATAPMRRLADRYVLELALRLFNGTEIPPHLLDQIRQLPVVMERGEGRASNVDRAVIDLIEAVSLQNRIGEILEAEVVDAEAGVVQTYDSAVRSRATQLSNVQNGDAVWVRIESSDPTTRKVRLKVVPRA